MEALHYISCCVLISVIFRIYRLSGKNLIHNPIALNLLLESYNVILVDTRMITAIIEIESSQTDIHQRDLLQITLKSHYNAGFCCQNVWFCSYGRHTGQYTSHLLHFLTPLSGLIHVSHLKRNNLVGFIADRLLRLLIFM